MTQTAVPPNLIESLAQQLKLLANPKRLRILNLLMEGVQCNCELGDALDMPINLISHHMGLLRKAGLVNIERDAVDARWVYFSLNEPAIVTLNEAYHRFFDLARIQPRHPQCGPQGSTVLLPAEAE
jgi:ArsR family transcriptional regulator